MLFLFLTAVESNPLSAKTNKIVKSKKRSYQASKKLSKQLKPLNFADVAIPLISATGLAVAIVGGAALLKDKNKKIINEPSFIKKPSYTAKTEKEIEKEIINLLQEIKNHLSISKSVSCRSWKPYSSQQPQIVASQLTVNANQQQIQQQLLRLQEQLQLQQLTIDANKQQQLQLERITVILKDLLLYRQPQPAVNPNQQQFQEQLLRLQENLLQIQQQLQGQQTPPPPAPKAPPANTATAAGSTPPPPPPPAPKAPPANTATAAGSTPPPPPPAPKAPPANTATAAGSTPPPPPPPAPKAPPANTATAPTNPSAANNPSKQPGINYPKIKEMLIDKIIEPVDTNNIPIFCNEILESLGAFSVRKMNGLKIKDCKKIKIDKLQINVVDSANNKMKINLYVHSVQDRIYRLEFFDQDDNKITNIPRSTTNSNEIFISKKLNDEFNKENKDGKIIIRIFGQANQARID